MLTISQNYIRINHIMWQPTNSCKKACSGCYVRLADSFQYRGDISEQIVDLIYKERKVVCDQFTVSLDTIPPKSIPPKLLYALQLVWASSPGPELCITVRNQTTLSDWIGAMGYDNSPDSRFFKPIRMISISRLPRPVGLGRPLYVACQENKILLNWNLLPKYRRTSVEGDSIHNNVYGIVDHIYLTLLKPPLGDDVSPIDVHNYASWHKTAYPTMFGVKVSPDSCTHSCGAGIDKAHVWPDGSVTGCPYDAKRVVAKHDGDRPICAPHELCNTWEELRLAVAERKSYSMQFCKVKEAMKKYYE